MIIEDYEQMRREYELVRELEAKGKCCTMCVMYHKYENPAKGMCAGWCEKEKTEHPDKPHYWGVSKKHVCSSFGEVL